MIKNVEEAGSGYYSQSSQKGLMRARDNVVEIDAYLDAVKQDAMDVETHSACLRGQVNARPRELGRERPL